MLLSTALLLLFECCGGAAAASSSFFSLAFLRHGWFSPVAFRPKQSHGTHQESERKEEEEDPHFSTSLCNLASLNRGKEGKKTRVFSRRKRTLEKKKKKFPKWCHLQISLPSHLSPLSFRFVSTICNLQNKVSKKKSRPNLISLPLQMLTNQQEAV